MNSYILGEVVRVSVAYTIAGVATDPTTATVKVLNPLGALTTATPTKDSTGNYHYDFATTIEGLHYYRFEGTGACVAAGEGQFLTQTNFS